MARPSKYDWETIKAAYESTGDLDHVVKHFRVPKQQLWNRISNEKWVVKLDAKHAVEQISDGFVNLTNITQQNPNITNFITEQLNVEMERQKFNQGQFDLARDLRELMNKMVENKEIDAQNIRNITGAMKDLNDSLPGKESTSTTSVNITKNTQNNFEKPTLIFNPVGRND